MKKFIFLFVFALTCVGAIAQSITLTFTGRDAKNQYVKLNRIVITNLTQNWQETIYYPDTILRMGGTSIDDFENANEFKLSQNVPNPFDGTTELALQMPEAGKVSLTVYDMNGKKVTAYHGKLAAGVHTFRVLLNTTQSYLLTARCGNEMATIKMVNNSGFGENAITYLGECKFYPPITTLKGGKGNTNNPFAFSDNMMYFGFATINGKEYTSDTIKKKQTVSESLILNFVINVCQPPIVTTVDISNITQNSVVCGGNVTCDGESVVTARGVCWNTSTTPTILGNHTTDSCGLGEFTSKISELAEGTTYHLRAYATNNAGTAYGDEKIFTTWSHCVAAPTVTDYDKNVYNTIQIGEQCWMRENLRTTKYADGTPIEKGNGTSNDVAPYWYFPNNDASNMETYGLLYNWKAVMHNASSSSTNPSNVQGICPEGWHMPSDTEWTQMINYVSSLSQYMCGRIHSNIAKALADTSGWTTNNESCATGNKLTTNNATGFSALPAGFFYDGTYRVFGKTTRFWSATNSSLNKRAYYRSIKHNQSTVERSTGNYSEGLSVRCILGAVVQEPPTVITSEVRNVTTNSAICGGNVTSDGESSITARGVCWNTSPNPTINNNHTSDGVGTGEFSSKMTELIKDTTYYVRAYATNKMGTSYGEQESFMPSDFPNCGIVSDFDKNVYKTVQIGNQCWMRENLKTTKYADGITIEQGSTASEDMPYWYYPNNVAANKETFGLLYNWKAIMRNSSSSNTNPSSVQGICPTGWHVPSLSEWRSLISNINRQNLYECNGIAGYIGKSLASSSEWKTSTYNCAVGNDQRMNNATGFSAFPAGTNFGSSHWFREYAIFWTATANSTEYAYCYSLSYDDFSMKEERTSKYDGSSVRCVKDKE